MNAFTDQTVARDVTRKLSQLQSQIEHLPAIDPADYGHTLLWTRRFAYEVIDGLLQLFPTSNVPSIEPDQAQKA